MLGQLRVLGIDFAGARNTALRSLTEELPPTLVVNELGYSYQVIQQTRRRRRSPMAGYARKGALPR
jgi:hypothetical protein